MKKKLQLRTVIDLKNSLEEKIALLENDVVKYNNTEINVYELIDKLEYSYEQLIFFKEAIQTANKGKSENGKTNNYYIYLLSNLKRKRILYNKIDCNDKKKSQITIDEINDYIRDTEDEMRKIRDKLTFFNDSKSITVEFNKKYAIFYDI